MKRINKYLITLIFFIVIFFLFIKYLPYNPYSCELKETDIKLHNFLRQRDLPSNIYVHSTNSPTRLVEYAKYYKNFEVDIYIDRNNLDIFHFPEHISINFSFRNLISLLDDPKEHDYWLDVKNLDSSNVNDLVTNINAIKEESSLSIDQFLIESRNLAVLKILNEEGFNTAFYLPKSIFSNSDCSSPKDLEFIADKINIIEPVYISFPLTFESEVHSCLIPITGNVPMISWANSVEYIFSGRTKEYKKFMVDHALVTDLRSQNKTMHFLASHYSDFKIKTSSLFCSIKKNSFYQ